jgi:hypothetical protein
MPEELKDTTAPNSEPKKNQFATSEEFKADLARYKRQVALGEKYGSEEWYHWSIENWGVKWNANTNEVIKGEDGRMMISFMTPWGIPDRFLLALSKKFPKIVFCVLFADEDYGYNCGYYEYKSGHILEENLPEGGGAEARAIAKDLLGDDPNEE